MENITELSKKTLSGRIKEHLALMDEMFLDIFDDKNDDIQVQIRDAVTSGGKRIRPTLAFLASCFGGQETGEIVPLMAMIELMHSGSLVHDDVVDHADTRRGRATISKTRGGHIAVQYGDYALARSMSLLKRYTGTGINELLAETSMEMCLGELQQLRGEYNLEIQSVEDYLLRIKRKTAYLMASSCYAGAIVGGLPDLWKKRLKEYGLSFGMAFQLKDDILDYEGADKEGKPAFQDMKRGIYTLPLLYTLSKDCEPQLSALIQKREKTDYECVKILEWVRQSGGIEYTERLIGEYIENAVLSLQILPDCEIKETLIEMITMERKVERTYGKH